jgi:membrane-associated phospholipid phosphatase
VQTSVNGLAIANSQAAVKRKLAGYFSAAAALALAAAVCVRFDTQWSATLRAGDLPGDVEKAINLSEVFAHGFGVAAVLGSVFFLTPGRRRVVWCAVLVTLVSGLSANLMKGCVVRVRPHAQATISVVGHDSGDPTRVAVAESYWDARQRSFPSGHAATAWGLAIGLGWVFPRGVWLFAIFAMMASLQRLTSGAHFPSDVLAGASIACLSAAGLWCIPRVRRLVLSPDEKS